MQAQNTNTFNEVSYSSQINLEADYYTADFQIKTEKVLDNLITNEFNPHKRKHAESSEEPSLSRRNVKRKKSTEASQQEITLSNGDRYIYKSENGKREGPAIGYLKNGSVVECIFVKDVLHGKACLTNKNGDKISYEYDFGVKRGNATESKANGQAIEFTFVDGFREGKATLVDSTNGVSLEFRYRRGVKEGPAKLSLQDKFTLKFSFMDGLPEGYAEFQCATHKIMFNFSEGIREGCATAFYQDGRVVDFYYDKGNAVPKDVQEKNSPSEDSESKTTTTTTTTTDVVETKQPGDRSKSEATLEGQIENSLGEKPEQIQADETSSAEVISEGQKVNEQAIKLDVFESWLNSELTWADFETII